MTKHSITGVWRVQTIGAPFAYHMFVFHGDGTMQQSNPPAGNTQTSDTAGMGVWENRGGMVVARFEEFRLDLATGEVTRGVVDFELKVRGDRLTGSCEFNIYDSETELHIAGPYQATVEGQRVKLQK